MNINEFFSPNSQEKKKKKKIEDHKHKKHTHKKKKKQKKRKFSKNIFLENKSFPMKHFKTNGYCYVFQYM